MYKNEIKLSLDLIQRHLGPYERKVGSEYEWQCPICTQNGGDTHKDNLRYNEKKNVLYCFSDENHSREILSEIYKSEWQELKQNANTNKTYIKDGLKAKAQSDKEFFKTYQEFCSFSLEQEQGEYANILMQKRGLTAQTALDVGLGIDIQKNIWVIPTFKYTTSTNPDDYEITSFEYRPLNFSKEGLYREKGTKLGLAMINAYGDKTEIIVIVEGYFDGYTLLQFLTEKGQADFYHIVSCSHGVKSLLKEVSEIDFKKYKKHYLFIDNDDDGRKCASEIMKKYPFMENFVLPCGCKDFNEHYLKCIKGGQNDR